MSAKEPFLARLWFSYDTAGPAPHDGIKEPPPPTGPPARATQALPYSTYLWVRDDVEEAGSAVEMVAATATAGRVVAAIQPGPPAPATQERAPGATG